MDKHQLLLAIKNTSYEDVKNYKSKVSLLRHDIDIESLTQSDTRKSAVMAIIFQKNGQQYLILIKRASYYGTHSGQISFPGGKAEPEDIDLQHTAIRETLEEIGVSVSKNEIIHELQTIYIPPSNFLVYPFLAFLDKEPDSFKPDSREVDEIITLNINDLKQKPITKSSITTFDNSTLTVPSYVFNNQIVWGATASILSEIICYLEKIDS
jgi:8-oxo-dGTP pyrophosphatase MutT (NUDIX family)